MVSKHSYEMYSLIWLLFFAALCGYVTYGQESDVCGRRYLTINTFDDIDAMNITCLGTDADCEVFFTPQGTGCNDNPDTSVANVRQGYTRQVAYELPYGAGLCSNYQISVQQNKIDAVVDVQLPRATQSGKKFHAIFDYLGEPRSYKCSITALATPATVTYSLASADTDINIQVDKYRTESIEFNVGENLQKILRIVSDASIIVSCYETTNSEAHLVVLEPISAQPILIATRSDAYYTPIISDCSTNTRILDSNRVTIKTGLWNGGDCDERDVSGSIASIFTENVCTVLLTPNDAETCISVLSHNQERLPIAVGVPESKFTSRFANHPYSGNVFLFSFSLGTCSFTSEQTVEELELTWIPGDLEDEVSVILSRASLSNYDSIQCSSPVYALLLSRDFVSFRGGFQANELWTEFFKSESCPSTRISPTPGTPGTPETPTSAKPKLLPFSIGLVNIFACIILLLSTS